MWKRARAPFLEDTKWVNIAETRLNGGTYRDWSFHAKRLAYERQKTGKVWGWSDPRTSEIIDDVKELFPKGVYIRIHRDRHELIDRLCEVYGPPTRWRNGYPQLLEWATDLVDRRTACLDIGLNGVQQFDVSYEDIVHSRLGAAITDWIELASGKALVAV